jgi:hypothetical protein
MCCTTGKQQRRVLAEVLRLTPFYDWLFVSQWRPSFIRKGMDYDINWSATLYLKNLTAHLTDKSITASVICPPPLISWESHIRGNNFCVHMCSMQELFNLQHLMTWDVGTGYWFTSRSVCWSLGIACHSAGCKQAALWIYLLFERLTCTEPVFSIFTSPPPPANWLT